MGKYYQASKTKSQSRKSWCITFRHPLRKDSKGKTGLKVRRGLGTQDEIVAEQLVKQMNVLLANESYWNLASRAQAFVRFDKRIVSAFYDSIETNKVKDTWGIRESVIPLPADEEGYSKVQLLGTTGTGKTTLIRQFIGTHPEKDRFPSTSTSRTTVCDMEIILKDEEEYKAVVTFFPLEKVRMYIEESVLNAGKGNVNNESEQNVSRKLLEHPEQRFRLQYILGSYMPKQQNSLANLLGNKGNINNTTDDSADKEKVAMEEIMKRFIALIQSSSNEVWQMVHEELGMTIGKLDEKEEEVVEELFDDVWKESQTFNRIVEDILDEVEKRFSFVQEGYWKYNNQEWPESWKFSCKDRVEFINVIKNMTSNYAGHFGRLLTPLVQGIRISGPFQPSWWEGEIPKLILMDGEGLGHQAGLSLSTKTSKKLEEVDAVLLVDNATSPMLSEPITVLKYLVTSGHAGKLRVCFTHFDEVEGDNLPTLLDKQHHILGSVMNALNEIANVLGNNANRTLSRHLEGKLFFAGGIHKIVDETNSQTVDDLRQLIESLQDAKKVQDPSDVFPIYEGTLVALSIQSAASDFYKWWDGKLGLSGDKTKKEHWGRIKALSRRLAELGEDEYADLRPIADLISCLREQVYKSIIDNPAGWSNPNVPEEWKQQAKDRIATEFNKNLHNFVRKMMWDNQLPEWVRAFERSGTGSSYLRADDLKGIYRKTIPVPHDFETKGEVVNKIYQIFKHSIEESGGRMKV